MLLEGRHILVTGAAGFIGYHVSQVLLARGDDVIGVCRTSSAELDGLGVRVEAGVDVSSGDEVSALTERLAGTSIDPPAARIHAHNRRRLDEAVHA